MIFPWRLLPSGTNPLGKYKVKGRRKYDYRITEKIRE